MLWHKKQHSLIQYYELNHAYLDEEKELLMKVEQESIHDLLIWGM